MSEQPGSLAAAIAAVQADLPVIAKEADGQVGTRHYKYASYLGIHREVFPLLCKYQLVWNSRPTMHEGQFVLAYRLLHLPTGEADTGNYPLPTSTPQTMGGAITYAKRYALGAVLDLMLGDDDDAAGAEAETKAPMAERVAAGRMSATETRAHNKLAEDVRSSPKRAERSRGRDDTDPWRSADPDAPGSITDAQRARIMAGFSAAGIGHRDDRLAYAMSKLDLPELATSNDLSMVQASDLIKHLDKETAD